MKLTFQVGRDGSRLRSARDCDVDARGRYERFQLPRQGEAIGGGLHGCRALPGQGQRLRQRNLLQRRAGCILCREIHGNPLLEISLRVGQQPAVQRQIGVPDARDRGAARAGFRHLIVGLCGGGNVPARDCFHRQWKVRGDVASLLCQHLSCSGRRAREIARVHRVQRDVGLLHHIFWIERDRAAPILESLGEMMEKELGVREIPLTRRIARIGADERRVVLGCFFVIPRAAEIVRAERPIFLALVHAIDERERLVIRCLRFLDAAEPLTAHGEARVRASEVRVELDRASVMRNRVLVAPANGEILCDPVLMKRLERGGREGFAAGRLCRVDGLVANSRAHLGRQRAHSRQHLGLRGG